MQKLIKQILEGNFDYENGSLDFSCSKIELSVKRGEIYEGSFHIYGTRDIFTSGSVVSSDLRMECLNTEFLGPEEEISYRFDSTSLEEGDVVKGDFYIISNQGEYYIPFTVTVERSTVISSVGSIKNLFHFANLAKSNWQEAVKLFYSPEFVQVFTGGDMQYIDDYIALSAVDGVEQNLEEFLIRVNKKQKAEYVIDENELMVELPEFCNNYNVVERQLRIVRNGWGYTRLFVECMGEFHFTEQEELTDDDFLDNSCNLSIFVDTSLCKKGKNFGRIRLYNSFVDMKVSVTVKVGENIQNAYRLTEKRSMVQLMEFYQAYRMRKISTSTWLKETGKLVDMLVAIDENNIASRLFQAQMLITEERINEAGWILDHVAELLEQDGADNTLLAYYLYLTTLVHDDIAYVVKVSSKVEHIYRQDNSNWRVGWLLLYLSEEYNKSASGKWLFLEKQFCAGCTSPVIYIEAISLLNHNPALLRKLDHFEYQVLHYGAKQAGVKDEVIEQMLYLADKGRDYSPVFFETLQILYNNKKDERILREICSLLIKGNKVGNKYFEWYRAGVERRLRITNLYEYYVMSLDMDKTQEIPKIVLMYFSYQSSLNYSRIAYLFDYVLQHKDKLWDVYESYRDKVVRFTLEQLKRGRISRSLANIYNHVLEREMITEENCGIFSRLLFANYIRVENSGLQKVYVYHRGVLEPEEYTLTNGCTWVSLYGSNYTIVFEDARSNRFVKNVDYTIEKLMLPAKFLHWIMPYDCENPSLDIYLCEEERAEKESSESNAARMVRVLNYGKISPACKVELYRKMIRYYYEADKADDLNEYLEAAPLEIMCNEDINEVVEYMVLSGHYEMAGELLHSHGPYFVNAKLLARFLGGVIEQSQMVEDTTLLAAATYAFKKGKYDGNILQYLMLYYRGMSRDLRELWKAAKAYGMDCYKLTERILVQMLYSGAFVGEKMELFREYLSCGAAPEVEEAFLAQCSYECFVHAKVTEELIFEEIQRLYQSGANVDKICKLALLKFCGERGKALTMKLDNEMVETFLREMLGEGVRLEIFRAYMQYDFVQQELADKTIVEYYTTPGVRVCIHYLITAENSEANQYVTENMKEVYQGVFFKEFVLFFGESLQYYITEESNGEEQLTESGSLQMSDMECEEEDSKYRLINDMEISKSLQDYDTMEKLLAEYYRKNFMNGKFFELM